MSVRGDLLVALGIVARRFGTMLDEVAFLGGACAVLHVTDAGAPPPRPTRDIDVIVEVGSTTDYLGRLSDELRARGFEVDAEEAAPQCRWVVEGIKVDVMPTREDVLGLKNRWFDAALRHPTRYRLPGGPEILLVGAPYFVATKLEAFADRGGGDFVASHDIEDIMAVVDGRASLVEEVAAADDAVRGYVAEELSRLLAVAAFLESVPGHLPGDPGSQARVAILLERLRRLAAGGERGR